MPPWINHIVSGIITLNEHLFYVNLFSHEAIHRSSLVKPTIRHQGIFLNINVKSDLIDVVSVPDDNFPLTGLGENILASQVWGYPPMFMR